MVETMCSPDFPPVQLSNFGASFTGLPWQVEIVQGLWVVNALNFRLRRRIAMDRRGVFPSNMEVLPATDEASTSQSWNYHTQNASFNGKHMEI